MRIYLIIMLFLLSSILQAQTKYFVATNGNDSNPGTIGEPFATWQKLNDVLTAGDTAYIRGGTYTTYNVASTMQCRWNGLTGTASDTIKIWAYPGESPVWDLSGIDRSGNSDILLQINQCDYLWVRGLRITNAPQQLNGSFHVGLNIVNSSHCIIEHCTVDHIGGQGFCMTYEGYGGWDNNVENSEYNLILNCDSYSNADPLSASPYDGSNGFNIIWNPEDSPTNNPWCPNTTFRGCRAWYNSDDGWDCFMGGSTGIIFENCWSFWNGYVNGIPNYEGAIGVGFKMGPQINHDLDNDTLATFVNCIAAQNTHSGFTGNYSTETYGFAIINMYNCLAYNNSTPNPPGGGLGIWFTYGGTPNCTVRNSIAIRNNNEDAYWSQINDDHEAYWTESHNTWNYSGSPFDPNTTISADSSIALTNYKSLDVSELTASRKSNGDLPDVDFGHLQDWADLKGAGVDVGYPFDGAAPDIGVYFDYVGGSAPPVTPPVTGGFIKSGNKFLKYNGKLLK